MIVIASTNELKRRAVEQAQQKMRIPYHLVAVQANSAVSEQPKGKEEILRGAMNRSRHAAQMVPSARMTVAIESGLLRRRFLSFRGRYYDTAAIVAFVPRTGEYLKAWSAAVTFPQEAVEEAFRRGEPWTAGKVLEEWGIVKDHHDPHLSLVGKSREQFLEEAVSRLFRRLRRRGVL